MKIMSNKTLEFSNGTETVVTSLGFCTVPDWVGETEFFKLACSDKSIQAFESVTTFSEAEKIMAAEEKAAYETKIAELEKERAAYKASFAQLEAELASKSTVADNTPTDIIPEDVAPLTDEVVPPADEVVPPADEVVPAPAPVKKK